MLYFLSRTKLKAISDEAYEAVISTARQPRGKPCTRRVTNHRQYLLPQLVAAFLRENPRISITATSGNTDEMLVALTAGRIQLALVEGPGLRKDVHVEPYMQDHMVLVVPASHEWADHEIEINQLKHEHLLMREFGSGSRRVVETALSKAGLKKKDLKTTMELDSTEALLSAVEAGLGVTFVSRWAVRNQLALGTLRLARVRKLRLSRMFSLAYPLGPEPSGNAGVFRRFMLHRSAELLPRVTGKARSRGLTEPRNRADRSKHRPPSNNTRNCWTI